ncbi:hypothetical protein [Myroides odoratus]
MLFQELFQIPLGNIHHAFYQIKQELNQGLVIWIS